MQLLCVTSCCRQPQQLAIRLEIWPPCPQRAHAHDFANRKVRRLCLLRVSAVEPNSVALFYSPAASPCGQTQHNRLPRPPAATAAGLPLQLLHQPHSVALLIHLASSVSAPASGRKLHNRPPRSSAGAAAVLLRPPLQPHTIACLIASPPLHLADNSQQAATLLSWRSCWPT
jgi:hypothetical protein